MFINVKQKFIFIFIILLNGLKINALFAASASTSHIGSSGLTAQQQKLKDAIINLGKIGFGGNPLNPPIEHRIEIPLDELVKDINQSAKPKTNGNTVLMIASLNGALDLVKFLLQNGADPKKPNKSGRNAIDLAPTKQIKDILLGIEKIEPSIKSETIDSSGTKEFSPQELDQLEVIVPTEFIILPKSWYAYSEPVSQNFINRLKDTKQITFSENNTFIPNELVISPRNKFFDLIKSFDQENNLYKISGFPFFPKQIGKISINNKSIYFDESFPFVKVPASLVVEAHPKLNRLMDFSFSFDPDNKFKRGEIVHFKENKEDLIGIIVSEIREKNEYKIQYYKDGKYQTIQKHANEIGKLKLNLDIEATQELEKFPRDIQSLITESSNVFIWILKAIIQNTSEFLTEKDAIFRLAIFKRNFEYLQKHLNETNDILNLSAISDMERPHLITAFALYEFQKNKGKPVLYQSDIDQLKRTQKVQRFDEIKPFEIKDAVGYTPLLYAVYLNKPIIVEYLIKQGADINAKTKDGLNAIDLATQYLKSDEMVNTIDNAIKERNKNKK